MKTPDVTEQPKGANAGCVQRLVRRVDWVLVFLIIALLNIGMAIWVAVKYGPHLGVMCALISHVIFRGIKICTR